jgi:hypothetical protein
MFVALSAAKDLLLIMSAEGNIALRCSEHVGLEKLTAKNWGCNLRGDIGKLKAESI